MLQWMRLSAGLILTCCIPLGVKATNDRAYKLRQIAIVSVNAIEPLPKKFYPYLRLAKWFCPTTDASLIYRQIGLNPEAVFYPQDLLRIKRTLAALPYFSTVSVTSKLADPPNELGIADIIIQTKDRFPINVNIDDPDEGPLFTLTHNNAWGYGHILTNQFFLKKRWGYGLDYEIPKLKESYLMGGQCYRQIDKTYVFDFQNLWIGRKSFALQTAKELPASYLIMAVSCHNKQFKKRPRVTARNNSAYHAHQLILVKTGFVSDRYRNIHAVYTLHNWERLPKGGSVEMLYGYQKSEFKIDRHYFGINLIKNIAHASLQYLHLGLAAGTFLHKQKWEEGVLKLTIDYAGPPLIEGNTICPFMHINYITGFNMPKERGLGISYRDPDALEKPDLDTLRPVSTPIHARLNVHLATTLHKPLMVNGIRFVFLGFTNLIALYDRDNMLIDTTLVKSYGIGLRLAYMKWPTVECKMAYSPLLGKTVPSIQLSICHFKNALAAKPTLVPYS